jgi:hypothetical protein
VSLPGWNNRRATLAFVRHQKSRRHRDEQRRHCPSRGSSARKTRWMPLSFLLMSVTFWALLSSNPASAQRRRMTAPRRAPPAEEPATPPADLAPWESGVSEAGWEAPAVEEEARTQSEPTIVHTEPEAELEPFLLDRRLGGFVVGLGAGVREGYGEPHVVDGTSWLDPMIISMELGYAFEEHGSIQHGFGIHASTWLAGDCVRGTRSFFCDFFIDDRRPPLEPTTLEPLSTWNVLMTYVPRLWLTSWCHFQARIGAGVVASWLGAVPSAQTSAGITLVPVDGLGFFVEVGVMYLLTAQPTLEAGPARLRGYDGWENGAEVNLFFALDAGVRYQI